jgi:hypothetical protein
MNHSTDLGRQLRSLSRHCRETDLSPVPVRDMLSPRAQYSIRDSAQVKACEYANLTLIILTFRPPGRTVTGDCPVKISRFLSVHTRMDHKYARAESRSRPNPMKPPTQGWRKRSRRHVAGKPRLLDSGKPICVVKRRQRKPKRR